MEQTGESSGNDKRPRRRWPKVAAAGVLLGGLVPILPGLLPGLSPPPSPRPAPPPPSQAGRPTPPDKPCRPPARVVARFTGRLRIGEHAALSYYRGNALCAHVALARRSGVRFLREDLSWADTETKPGRRDWSSFDRVTAAAASQGLTLLPILDDPPAWSGPARAIPTNPTRFSRFAALAVARYGPRGVFWRTHRRLPYRPMHHFEVWNEPWLPQGEGRPDPAAYARLFAASAARARAANPRVGLLLAVEDTWTPDDVHYRSWIDDMYAAVPTLNRNVAGVALHPYGVDPPARLTRAGEHAQTRRVELIRSSLVSHGAAHKPLWITEIGWSTCGKGKECHSESVQARDLRTLFELARTRWRGYVRAVFVYSLVDFKPENTPKKEGYFGLIRIDGTRKPGWRVLQQATRAER